MVSKVNKTGEKNQNRDFHRNAYNTMFGLHSILAFSKSYPGIESTCPQSAGEESLLTRDIT